MRPEHLRQQTDAALQLTVTVVEELGPTRYVHGYCVGQTLCAEWREDAPPEPGAVVRLAPTVVHAFDSSGRRLG